ncbi:MAG: PKD domain-containing protein [Vicingus serpentipes]|nr:PKD domain-containing protein [Vicingus serpentipes]
MDNLIKEKLEQFNVPYNESHWAEMEGRLNTIRTNKIKRNVMSTIGVSALIAISSYFYYANDNNQLTETKNTDTTEIISAENNTPQKETTLNIKQTEQKNSSDSPTVNLSQNNTTVTDKNVIEEKDIDKTISSPVNVTENTNNTNPKETILSAEFIIFNNYVCMGEEVSFETQEKTVPVSYHWDFGDGTTSVKQNPTHRYNESGKFDVTLTLINRQTGVETKHTERNAVTILPQPQADFSYNETALKHDDNKLKYPYTTFYNKDVSNDNTYVWNFGNGETTTSPNPQTIYNQKGKYTVFLTVKNSYGCYSSTSKNITIQHSFNLYAPNAFTPDGDGENDAFIPKALLGWDVQFEMIITDKTGKVVFQSSDKNEPWKGKLNNIGASLPAGIYLWKVITYDADKNPHQHMGKINLLN